MTPKLQRHGLSAWLIVLAAIGWLALATSALAQSEPRFPALTGRVVDQARLLSPAKEAELTSKLEALERESSDQLVVVTVDSLQGFEIEDFGYRLGRAWGIGQKESDNGVLLLVAPEERKVRIEVGYGLEPILTDALSALIIHEKILPAFREGYYERGIEQGVDAIDQQLRLDPDEAAARAAAVETQEAEAPIGPAILIGAIFLLMFLGMMGGLARGGRRGRGSGISPVLIWAASEAMRNSGRGGRGGGFGGFGGGGGGGFGGGGGSFGGGGASGGW